MRIVAIAAVADNGVIGSGEDMLWHIPADFRRFKAVTTGNTIIFGRRTHEQIGLLPNRRTIVVTRQPDWSAEGVEVAHSIEDNPGAVTRFVVVSRPGRVPVAYALGPRRSVPRHRPQCAGQR